MTKPDYPEEEKRIDEFIPSPLPSPEKLVTKLQSYERLTNESKFVINIVLNTPTEFFHAITTETGRITAKRIRLFLENRWPTFVVNYVMKELKKWVSTF